MLIRPPQGMGCVTLGRYVGMFPCLLSNGVAIFIGGIVWSGNQPCGYARFYPSKHLRFQPRGQSHPLAPDSLPFSPPQPGKTGFLVSENPQPKPVCAFRREYKGTCVWLNPLFTRQRTTNYGQEKNYPPRKGLLNH